VATPIELTPWLTPLPFPQYTSKGQQIARRYFPIVRK
jgi:hypothetical protein